MTPREHPVPRQAPPASTGADFPLSTELQERNREIVAERLGWPDGALEACRETEAGAPGWYCWWTPAPWPDPGFRPAYGAARTGRRPVGDPGLYARTPDELAERIAERERGGLDG